MALHFLNMTILLTNKRRVNNVFLTVNHCFSWGNSIHFVLQIYLHTCNLASWFELILVYGVCFPNSETPAPNGPIMQSE